MPTHAIDGDSAAVDGGVAMSCEPTDARGFGRSGTCDSGAFELGGVAP